MYNVNDYINSLNTVDLLSLKTQIENKIDEYYHLKENFYLHEEHDDYIYIIDYIDGSHHYEYIGARAYRKYIGDSSAIAIRRKTKDLFPVYETLLEKEVIKAWTIRKRNMILLT